MAKVIVFRGRRKEASYELARREMVIGRGEGADIRVDNPVVSRTHATLAFERGAWRVKDLKSPNGLHVNGQRVTDHELQVGDRIELGQHIVVFAGAETCWDVDTVGDQRLSDLGGDEPTAILPPSEIQSIHRRVKSRMKAHMVLVHGTQRREIPLARDRYVVGFSEDCDIRLPGRALFGKKVAELARRGNEWSILSLSSLAPVRVGGQKQSTRVLKDGDVIGIKDAELTFHTDMS